MINRLPHCLCCTQMIILPAVRVAQPSPEIRFDPEITLKVPSTQAGGSRDSQGDLTEVHLASKTVSLCPNCHVIHGPASHRAENTLFHCHTMKYCPPHRSEICLKKPVQLVLGLHPGPNSSLLPLRDLNLCLGC